MINEKKEDISTGDGKYIVTAPVIIKDFIEKNGTNTQKKEIYLERSIQDYFIKFCESKISREELENYISEMNGEIKAITFVIEFRDGYWDICDGNYMNESRMGEYVIIHRIIKNKNR